MGDINIVTDETNITATVSSQTVSPSIGSSPPMVMVAIAGASGPSPIVTNGGTAQISVTSVGDRGPQGDVGPANTLAIGTVTSGATAAASITGVAPNQTLSLVLPQGATGPTGAASTVTGPSGGVGATGPTGAASTVAGPTGAVGATGSVGPTGSVGVSGREIEVQATSTYIQWRYVGDASWTNLIAIADITGPSGPAGAAGGLTIGALIALT